MAVNGKNAIAVDWDATCVRELWPREGDWLEGAREGLRALADQYDVYIWTTRIVGREYEDWHQVVSEESVAKQIAYVRRMLDGADLSDVNIFVSYPDHGVGKLSARAYVDDKAIRFEGDWPRHCGCRGSTVSTASGARPAEAGAASLTEQEDVLARFMEELRKPTGDGAVKRTRNEKPPWYEDDSHEASVFSHLMKWKKGETIDPESGAHTLVHAAWRLLAIACRETGNTPTGGAL